ncbi:hypothetical protein ACA910_011286 [Epithemia clementina (nom. ined.)]
MAPATTARANYVLYPYNRSEECTWQPEEMARNMAALISGADSDRGQSTSTCISSASAKTNHYDVSEESNTRTLSHQSSNSGHHTMTQPFLLSQGWSDRQVKVLRELYGRNRMPGDSDDDKDLPESASFRQRLRHYGQICTGPIASALGSQLKEPLIVMLLGSALISLILGNIADAVSIAIALLIVSAVAAVQEYRSEAAIEKLNHLVPHTCTVVRDGVVHDTFLAADLVLGDLVLLATGDRVPADCRVVDSVELTVDESSLTGENHPVPKTGEALNTIGTKAPSISQQDNICFCGTLIQAGRGRALVVAIGENTEFGKVASELATVTSRKSPLQTKMDELGHRLAFLSSIAIAIIAVLGWFMGRPFLETLTVAVSLAVAAIPEGLPICVTVTLALGVLRMAKRNAIVRKLPVVESLGCATAVASDKTGTLTQNEMTVRAAFCLAFPERQFGFTGVGYNPSQGKLINLEDYEEKGPSFDESAAAVTSDGAEREAISALFFTACLCNNATLTQSYDSKGGADTQVDYKLCGQPTELALLCAALKTGLHDPRSEYHRLQEIPFTSERKCMEVRARPFSGRHACVAFVKAASETPDASAARRPSFDGSLYFIKGMPEVVLGKCQTYALPDGSSRVLVEDDRTRTLAQSRRMAVSGLRVLALAYGQMLGNLTFAGIVGMEDPPRAGVAECVRQLRQGGVKVMMVTGDSKETAIAIAQRCGIISEPSSEPPDSLSGIEELRLITESTSTGDLSTLMPDTETGAGGLSSEALSGDELDAIPQENMAESIAGVKVFYRVVPKHKLAIVRALQQLGEIVVMTGDGVNDATALKGADIGVAMGKNGTDVAKEAADVVLADDDFRTITMAIAEGKGIFFNIRCFLAFQLSTSFAALTMASVATALGMPTPLNAMQILWINIIMDGPPAQSLGVEPVDRIILKAKPRKADDPIVTRALLLRAMTSAALIVVGTLYVFAHELEDGKPSRRDTTMTFMTFVNFDLFNAYACRSADRCFYELDPLGNPAFIWAVGGSIFGQLLLIFFPPLQEIFQTEALSLGDLAYIILLSSSVLWLDTARKVVCRRLFSDGYNPSPRTIRRSTRRKRMRWLGVGGLDSSKEHQATMWGSNKSKSKSLLAL